jgi:competence protein ComEC
MLAGALLTGWIALGLAASAARSHRGRLDCTFLSVGHGSAVVVRLPSGKTMLYDAGRFGSPRLGAQSIASCLWSYGVTHLDAVVLSHSDIDHYNALPDLLERFSVGAVYVSPQMFQRETPALSALREAIRDRSIPVRELSVGDRLAGGPECLLEVLHPPREGLPGRDNVNSLVLAIEHLGRRVLLTGDLQPPGLDAVVAVPPRDCDVLLAPHHGSRLSDPPSLAAWCTPEWVVISGSLDSYQPETAVAYRATGARVLHTGDVGAVRAIVDDVGIEVTGFLESP